LRKLPLEVAVSLLVRLEGRQDLQQPGWPDEFAEKSPEM
jgi:hypothetical protein